MTVRPRCGRITAESAASGETARHGKMWEEFFKRMKRTTIVLFAALVAVALISGCVAREPLPEREASAISETEAAESSSVPEQAEQSDPAEVEPSSEEETGEEFSDDDKKVLNDDMRLYVDYFGDEQAIGSVSELDPASVLSFCLMQAYRQRDLYGYFFESDGEGGFYIQSAIVTETASRLLGLTGFTATDAEGYDADYDCYRYNPEQSARTLTYALSSPKSLADGKVVYTADFFAADDKSMETLLYTLRYTFNVQRLNGMPHLQFVSKEKI